MSDGRPWGALSLSGVVAELAHGAQRGVLAAGGPLWHRQRYDAQCYRRYRAGGNVITFAVRTAMVQQGWPRRLRPPSLHPGAASVQSPSGFGPGSPGRVELGRRSARGRRAKGWGARHASLDAQTSAASRHRAAAERTRRSRSTRLTRPAPATPLPTPAPCLPGNGRGRRRGPPCHSATAFLSCSPGGILPRFLTTFPGTTGKSGERPPLGVC